MKSICICGQTRSIHWVCCQNRRSAIKWPVVVIKRSLVKGRCARIDIDLQRIARDGFRIKLQGCGRKIVVRDVEVLPS